MKTVNNKNCLIQGGAYFCGKKSKISGIKIIEVIEEYLRGEDSLNHLAEMLNVS